MLFIYPMWDSESERLGKQQCSPAGYAIHVTADLIGFAGLLLLVGLMVYFPATYLITSLPRPTYWIFLMPFAVGILGELLFSFSWWLARRKGFTYDGATRTASWNEDGKMRTYKWTK
ncbi:MAG: hypothetical protein SFU85_04495 [Candidatus Methylacidiphilales bacterium]|nr:hypothetical protein [Candidatus Methylacidiphilales bacterium]